jgi:hypothetical protein
MTEVREGAFMPDDLHEFIFELDLAIRDQVLAKLNRSPVVPLRKDVGPPESGVYALYWKEALVYVGKASQATTKSKRTLRARLNEHVAKISGRRNISLNEMTCRYLTIKSDWFVWAAEEALITHFDPPWRHAGFGSKVPGAGPSGHPPRQHMGSAVSTALISARNCRHCGK